MNNRRNGGFTLVELLVTIAVGSLITLAATTVLLLGLRINRQASDTMDRQYTVRIMMSVMEDMATGGTITGVEAERDSWTLLGENGPLMTYKSKDRTIRSGGNMVLMENIIASFVDLNEKNGILTFGIETEDGSYTSSVYCRQLQDEQASEPEPPKVDEEEIKEDTVARAAFLKALTSQYRMEDGSINRGLVLDQNKKSTGCYYSEWYHQKKGDYGWDEDTPWCACYVSWALWGLSGKEMINEPIGKQVGEHNLWYASVDYFVKGLKTEGDGHEFHASSYHGGTYEPVAGDLIFFDWTGKGDHPGHVGVVFKVDEHEVITIEGNSADSIQLRKYPRDSEVIMGYGVIDWVSDDDLLQSGDK